jgi:coenzyme F420-reducing hydrogenase alpha subunit
MGIEGRLTIDLGRAPDGSGRAAIASSRPLGMTRTFVGKSAHETVRTLPILYSVCGQAQGAAAAEACERALGIEANADTQAVRRLLVLTETVREHLIRAVMDWPRFLGFEAQKPDVLRVMRVCEDLRRGLDPGRTALGIDGAASLDAARVAASVRDLESVIEELVLAEPLEVWRSRRSAGDLDNWTQALVTPAQQIVRAVLDRGWERAGHAETRFLPPLADSDLIERLLGADAEAFVAAPVWSGAPHETSALSRRAASPLVRDLMERHGSGLLTRLAARIVEIADVPDAMERILESRPAEHTNGTQAAASRGLSGRGVAQVEAARGRLVHGVEIEREIVCRYAILAPTEWNFHAEGSAALGLSDIAGRSRDVRDIADLFVTAVDPCVGYELRVS